MNIINMKKTTIDGIEYDVSQPLNTQDMNYHFMHKGDDYLVDLCDVIEHFELENGASVDDAIRFANELNEDGVEWFWLKR